MLRIILTGLAAAAVIALDMGAAEAACPRNPVQASFSIWPAGTLSNGRHTSARHACGRLLQCIGGYSSKGERRCQWL